MSPEREPADGVQTHPDGVVEVLRRSPGRVRLAVNVEVPDPSLLEQGVEAVTAVRSASFGVRTGNLLVIFDPAAGAEESLLAELAAAVVRATRPPGPRGGPTRDPSPQRVHEHTVHEIETAQGWVGAEGVCRLGPEPARCIETILDFPSYPLWQQYVTAVEVLERDRRGRGTLVRTHGVVGSRAVTHLMGYCYPSPARITWEQVEGELEAIRGEWSFRASRGGGTRAVYRLEINPGLRLRVLLRGSLYAQIRDALFAHTFAELRRRIESGQGRPSPRGA